MKAHAAPALCVASECVHVGRLPGGESAPSAREQTTSHGLDSCDFRLVLGSKTQLALAEQRFNDAIDPAWPPPLRTLSTPAQDVRLGDLWPARADSGYVLLSPRF